MPKKIRENRRKASSKNLDDQRSTASLLSSIDAVVSGGKGVVSADNSIIIAMVQEALKVDRMETTFYVSPEVGAAVRQWYLTPRRIKEMDVKVVSKEELARIKSELGVNVPGGFSSRAHCPNGHTYGLFEFVQQGIREHGRERVREIMELKNSAVLRINPVQHLICPQCSERLMTIIEYYECVRDDGKLLYGCCRGEIPGTILA